MGGRSHNLNVYIIHNNYRQSSIYAFNSEYARLAVKFKGRFAWNFAIQYNFITIIVNNLFNNYEYYNTYTPTVFVLFFKIRFYQTLHNAYNTTYRTYLYT